MNGLRKMRRSWGRKPYTGLYLLLFLVDKMLSEYTRLRRRGDDDDNYGRLNDRQRCLPLRLEGRGRENGAVL